MNVLTSAQSTHRPVFALCLRRGFAGIGDTLHKLSCEDDAGIGGVLSYYGVPLLDRAGWLKCKDPIAYSVITCISMYHLYLHLLYDRQCIAIYTKRWRTADCTAQHTAPAATTINIAAVHTDTSCSQARTQLCMPACSSTAYTTVHCILGSAQAAFVHAQV
eukprot:16656-Heterococcus_DN1.PRE.1